MFGLELCNGVTSDSPTRPTLGTRTCIGGYLGLFHLFLGYVRGLVPVGSPDVRHPQLVRRQKGLRHERRHLARATHECVVGGDDSPHRRHSVPLADQRLQRRGVPRDRMAERHCALGVALPRRSGRGARNRHVVPRRRQAVRDIEVLGFALVRTAAARHLAAREVPHGLLPDRGDLGVGRVLLRHLAARELEPADRHSRWSRRVHHDARPLPRSPTAARGDVQPDGRGPQSATPARNRGAREDRLDRRQVLIGQFRPSRRNSGAPHLGERRFYFREIFYLSAGDIFGVRVK